MIDFFSFAAGFFCAVILSIPVVAIIMELREKRAVAFTKRFSVISEALSSLKALAFRLSAHLKKFNRNLKSETVNQKDVQKVKGYLEGIAYIFDTLSAGMMPPTEEIAMEALKGKKSSSEHRAYEDGIRFRDDVRKIRQLLEKEGLDGIGSRGPQYKPVASPNIQIINEDGSREVHFSLDEDGQSENPKNA